MKALAAIIFGLLFAYGQVGFSKMSCYEFPVSEFSKNLKIIKIKMTEESPKKSKILMFAERSKERFVETPFECRLNKKDWTCSQAQGAGDFSLKLKEEVATLETSYLNLLIGSVRGIVFSEQMSLNEEFALFRSEESLNEDELEQSRPKPFQLTGRKATCIGE